MPTGYTAAIYDNKPNFGLREYALTCARAFGAFYHLRDESSHAELTPPPPPNSYHKDELQKALDRLSAFNSMSAEELEAQLESDFQEHLRVYYESRDKRIALRARYDEMAAKVRAWEVPESHQAMRKFMLTQLQESRDFDASEKYEEPVPQKETLEEYRHQRIRSLAGNVSYHTEQMAKEEENHAKLIGWIDQFMAALPPEGT